MAVEPYTGLIIGSHSERVHVLNSSVMSSKDYFIVEVYPFWLLEEGMW